MIRILSLFLFFFFNDTATTEIYTLSLHDALPIYPELADSPAAPDYYTAGVTVGKWKRPDRKSTRLNSSHLVISYAVFCLKKKKKATRTLSTQKRQYRTQRHYLGTQNASQYARRML